MLVKEQLASKIRVADKNIPATGWLNDEQKAGCRGSQSVGGDGMGVSGRGRNGSAS